MKQSNTSTLGEGVVNHQSENQTVLLSDIQYDTINLSKFPSSNTNKIYIISFLIIMLNVLISKTEQ